MKPQHATFILQMIKHGDKLRAYRAAYPKAKGQSAIKAAERLLRRPEIAQEITSVVQDIRSQTVIETYKVMQQEQQVRILSVMKKREILNQIATCEMKVGRWIKEHDGYRMVYEDPRPRDIILAIDKDTKLEEACNRMRDVTDVKLSRYDIYIDGRPCDNPTAPINPDIPTGLIMIPKKTLPLSGGVGVGLIPNDNSGNKKEQNENLSPSGGSDLFRRDSEQVEGGSLALNKIQNQNSGNKKEQNTTRLVSPKCNPPTPVPSNAGAGGGKRDLLAEETPTCEPLHLSNSAPAPIHSWVKEYDYLTNKKQYIAEKQQRTEADPMSESFYKDFVRQRDAAPPPQVYSDEEVEAIKNKDKEQPPKPFCGKMYFPEKKDEDIL